MTASSLINQYLDKFYEYLIEKGYQKSTAIRYKEVIKFLISRNINPLDFEEVALKLRHLRKNKRIITNYLTVCKYYKEFIDKYVEETRPSVKYKVYLTKSDASVILQVLLKVAEMYNVYVKCKSCGKMPTCSKKCLVETAISLAKELLIRLNGQLKNIKNIN